MLGAIAGIAIAANDKDNDGNTVVSRGDRLGAVFNVDFDSEHPAPPRRDREDVPPPDRDRNPVPDDRDAPQSGVEYVTVGLKGHDFRYPAYERPFARDNDVVMVPLQATAKQLDLSVRFDRAHRRGIRIEGPEGVLDLERGSLVARMGGREITLPDRTFEREGVVYVPLAAIAQVSGENLYVNGTRFGSAPL